MARSRTWPSILNRSGTPILPTACARNPNDSRRGSPGVLPSPIDEVSGLYRGEEENMRESFRRAFAIALFTAGALLAARIAVPERSAAGSLSAAIIGMFPKQVGEFAYDDLKAARNYSW